MFGLAIAALITAVSGYMILKKYKAQTVLLCGGFAMMAMAIVFNFPPIVSSKLSTGFVWFDLFRFVDDLTSKRVAELGLLIMVCAGFAKFMDKIGASEAMVAVTARPLRYIKNPYLVVCGGYVIGQLLHPFIPSASSFGLLLMVTMFPIYVAAGVNRTTAAAVIITNTCLDLGPTSGNSVLAAKYAGMSAVDYFVNYQLQQAIVISIVMTVVHYFVAKYFAKKDALAAASEAAVVQEAAKQGATVAVPGFYALLPTVPLILVLAFGYFKLGGIDISLNVAMFIGVFVGLLCEFARSLDIKKTMGSIQIFFDGMGVQFATVVTLIVAGETFAKGLTSLGAIDTMIGAAQGAGFGTVAMVFVMSFIIMVCSLVMGSGNAPFFAFSAFAPDVAKKLGVEAVNLLLPMQLTSSIARGASPITAVVVAVSGVAGVSPFDVVKRTALPLVSGLIVTQIMTYLMFR